MTEAAGMCIVLMCVSLCTQVIQIKHGPAGCVFLIKLLLSPVCSFPLSCQYNFVCVCISLWNTPLEEKNTKMQKIKRRKNQTKLIKLIFFFLKCVSVMSWKQELQTCWTLPPKTTAACKELLFVLYMYIKLWNTNSSNWLNFMFSMRLFSL